MHQQIDRIFPKLGYKKRVGKEHDSVYKFQGWYVYFRAIGSEIPFKTLSNWTSKQFLPVANNYASFQTKSTNIWLAYRDQIDHIYIATANKRSWMREREQQHKNMFNNIIILIILITAFIEIWAMMRLNSIRQAQNEASKKKTKFVRRLIRVATQALILKSIFIYLQMFVHDS